MIRSFLFVGLASSVAACAAPAPTPTSAGAPTPTRSPDPVEQFEARNAVTEEVQHCARGADPVGKVSLSVEIAPSGRVTSAGIEGLGDGFEKTDAGACVMRALRDIRVMPFAGEPAKMTIEATVGLRPDAQSPEPKPNASPAKTAGGGLPREVIKRVIDEQRESMALCVAEGRERSPDLAGGVSVRFVIPDKGKVSRAFVAESTLPDVRARVCLRHVFLRLEFPAHEGDDVNVTYPMVFPPQASQSSR